MCQACSAPHTKVRPWPVAVGVAQRAVPLLNSRCGKEKEMLPGSWFLQQHCHKEHGGQPNLLVILLCLKASAVQATCASEHFFCDVDEFNYCLTPVLALYVHVATELSTNRSSEQDHIKSAIGRPLRCLVVRSNSKLHYQTCSKKKATLSDKLEPS